MNREQQRLEQDARREQNWKRWGPYLPDRQWSTVREDYSAAGDAWNYFPHDMARSRAYRWGEDGLLGMCDRQCRLCFSFAFWNGADPFLKERLFGLTGPEGNHGEDVKECYFFLDSTPTHSYMRALYKYPCGPFPYDELLRENRRRTRREPEFEIYHSDALDEYFDCYVEYAKGGPDDILIRLSVVNHSPLDRTLVVLPTCWFRNVWSWGREDEGYGLQPSIERAPDGGLLLSHPELGTYRFWVDQDDALFVFTENETNAAKLFGGSNQQPYVKDAFHRLVVDGEQGAVNPEGRGTKAAAVVRLHVPAGETSELRCRLSAEPQDPFTRFDVTMARALREADEFYTQSAPTGLGKDEMLVWRQALAGLFWSKKFYHYAPSQWMEGDPAHPPPPPQRRRGRNRRWVNHLYNRDVLLLPDAWEYPWYAAWDTAFHVVPLARIDPELAKSQLILLLREWYMHPNGQLPAYEWNFDDVNPPVHAWAAWRIYREDGARDTAFLGRIFHKLLLNFNWWINRTDRDGNNIFSGGFLGLDNVGAFDRSQLPPQMGELEQADATAWLAFYCLQMLQIALELAQTQPAYEDIASKFFEHFVAITSAMNGLGALGLWDEEDGFYYDLLHKPTGEPCRRLKVRSMVGLLPLIAVDYLEGERLRKLPGFLRRMDWFIKNRPHLSQHLERKADTILLAVATRDRLKRVLTCMLDPEEFLSPYGIRSLSRRHGQEPYILQLGGHSYRVGYEPGDSESGMFGGNSNWRGPVWFPVNYLLIGALEQYHKFYGNSLKVPAPDGSGPSLNLHQAANEIRRRLVSLFLPDASGARPSHRDCPQHTRPGWQQAVWFHEFFHGETGQGLGASHQTGWTALVAPLLEQLAEDT